MMQNIFGSKNLSGPKKNAEIDQTKICVFFLQILNSKIGPDPDFIFLNDDPQHWHSLSFDINITI